MQALKMWATPLTIGAFFLLAVTGVLMFLHLDVGMNKTVHEWLGWALVIGGLLHLATHIKSFMKHIKRPNGAVIIGAFLVILAASFFISDESDGNPVKRVMPWIEKASIAELASLTHQTPDALIQRLSSQGVQVMDPQAESANTLGQGDREKTMKILSIVFQNTAD